MKLNPPLLALALGAFGIGVTEFTPMGMLPLIAHGLGVSIPAAGLLVSAYALGVLVGAPVMTLAFARVPRRTLLIGLMGVFTVGNLLAALSDSYAMLLAARIITSFNHGAFFGVGSVVAASVVAPERRASAVAAMFTGLTIATIGGVPLAGDHFEVQGLLTLASSDYIEVVVVNGDSGFGWRFGDGSTSYKQTAFEAIRVGL